MNYLKSYLLGVFLIGFSYFSNAQSCADLQVVDLRGVPNFAQTDDLAVCGAADTLAILIFTDDPGDISNAKMTVHLESGMEYAGFQLTHYGGGTTIANIDPSVSDPEFLLNGVTGGEIYVAYIGVRAKCGIDLTNDYFVSLDFTYDFTDTLNNTISCTATQTIEEKYNNSFSIPVQNVQSTTPTDAVITALGTPSCQTIRVSQNGLDTYLDSTNFRITGLDVASSGVQVVSLKANGIDLPYTYVNNIFEAPVGSSYFSGNGNANPADNQFNTDEYIDFEVCYQADDCPVGNTDFPIKYQAFYGCGGDTCKMTQKTSFVKVQPAGSAAPTASVTLVSGTSICGSPGQMDLVVNNPNPNTNQALITEMKVGFNTCVKSNLGISDVQMNGVSLDPTTYSWVGGDIVIDFSTIAADPDGAGGLVDADGDGFFDDLEGGESINLSVFLEMTCGNDGSCSNVDCGFAQFYVEGKTNCGQSFKSFPAVTGSDIKYTATSDSTNLLADPANMVGITPMYNFGAYGGPSGAKTRELSYCYTFDSQNVTPCAGGATTYLTIDFKGDSLLMDDIDFVPGSAQFDDGSGFVAVADGQLSWDRVSGGQKILKLNIGNPAAGVQICYKVTVEMDEGSCKPRQYWTGNFKVIEECSDCAGGCEIVRACRQELFSGDPNQSGCACMFEQVERSFTRKNLGYTDKTMTTHVTLADKLANSPADLTRFMPGDTMTGVEKYVIHDMEFFTDLAWWSWQHWSTGADGVIDNGNAELMMDGQNSKLLEFSVIKNGTTTKVPVDLTTIPSCMRDQNAGTRYWRSPITNYIGDAPMIGNSSQNYKPGMSNYTDNNAGCLRYNSYDSRDNAYFGFTIYNGNDYYLDCRGEVNTQIADDANCLDDFLSTYNVAATDTFYFHWEVPIIKNPVVLARQVEEANGTLDASLVPVVPEHALKVVLSSTAYKLDPNTSGCYSYLAGTCGQSPIVETTIPGDITGKSEVTIDDCGGSASHKFTFDATIPNGWFVDEFRPLVNIKNVQVPIYKPGSFCGNAQITDINGVTSPIDVTGTNNLSCVDTFCAVDSGNYGTIDFDFKNSGVTPFGVGLNMTQDSMTLTYDLCMLCPDVAPITGYKMIYDWEYLMGEPSSCGYNNNTVNTATNNPTLYPNRYIRVDASGNPIPGNWYEALLPNGVNTTIDTSADVIIDDQRLGTSGLVATNESGTNLLASSVPGSSVEVVELKVCATAPPAGGVSGITGVMANVQIPPSVSLVSVKDGANADLTFTLVNTDTLGVETYRIDLPDLAEGACTTIKLGTTLLFCPDGSAPPPTICTNFSGGCAPANVMSALAGKGEGCAGAEVCYSYIFGEAELQTSWVLPANGAPMPELCDEIELGFLIKNVKLLTLLNLNVNVDLPQGLQVVSGTWEYSYAGELYNTWHTIPDPDIINGNHYEYSDDTWNTDIHANGLPGVNAGLDSNKVAIRFRATTICDQFLSGSVLNTQTFANDPCGAEPLTTGEVQSPPVILQGADPANYAQLLTFANPEVAYCGASANEFSLTALNVSDNPTADSVTVCLTIPSELTYQAGSVVFSNPSFTPQTITSTQVGDNMIVCFDAPKLLPGEQFSFKFSATQGVSEACGSVKIGMDIQSFVDDITCTTGGTCGVNVQNSINPYIFLTLGPPLATADIRATEACSNSGGTRSICYEIDLVNPGPDYSGNVHVGWHEDISGNGVLDSFDPEIAGNDHNVNVLSGDTVTISMCMDIPEGKSCPMILAQTYASGCNCKTAENLINNIIPAYFDALDDEITICPGDDLDITVCTETEAGQFALVPSSAGTVSLAGNTLTVHLNPGATDNGPVSLKLTQNTGSCTNVYTKKLYQPSGINFGPYAAQEVCKTACANLDLNLPTELQNATISWSPTTYLDDPTIEKPEICNPAADVDYTVTVTLPGGCSASQTYPVTAMDCPPEITVNLATPSACEGVSNTYSLDVTVTYANATPGESIVITVGGVSQTFTISGSEGTQIFTLTGLSADGTAGADVTASYVANPAITNTLIGAYDVPANCSPCPTTRCLPITISKH